MARGGKKSLHDGGEFAGVSDAESGRADHNPTLADAPAPDPHQPWREEEVGRKAAGAGGEGGEGVGAGDGQAEAEGGGEGEGENVDISRRPRGHNPNKVTRGPPRADLTTASFQGMGDARPLADPVASSADPTDEASGGGTFAGAGDGGVDALEAANETSGMRGEVAGGGGRDLSNYIGRDFLCELSVRVFLTQNIPLNLCPRPPRPILLLSKVVFIVGGDDGSTDPAPRKATLISGRARAGNQWRARADNASLEAARELSSNTPWGWQTLINLACRVVRSDGILEKLII